MAAYDNLPTIDVDFLKIGRLSIGTKGMGLSGGRNGLGESVSMETSGGGVLVVTLGDCFTQSPIEHEYANWLAARMNGSFRFVNLPLMVDWSGPFPVDAQGRPQPIISGTPHSDGTLFSDGSGYWEATVFGRVGADAALHAGQLTVDLFGAPRALRLSDWFSIQHSVKGHRAYRYWEASEAEPITATIDGQDYTGTRQVIALDRPLRQAVTAGTRIDFVRPKCVVKFPDGFYLDWEVEGFWRSRPTFQFVEAF